MAPLRGLFASLGAGVSLSAAGSLALLAISAVLVLQGGLLGGGDAPDAPTLSLGEPTVVPRSEPGTPEDDSLVALAQPPEEPAGTSPGDDSASPVASGSAPAVERRDELSPEVDPPSRREHVDPPAPPRRRLLPEADESGRGLTGTTGNVVRSVSRIVSPVANTVLPESGGLIEELTDSLGDTVESTGGALRSTLTPLSGVG